MHDTPQRDWDRAFCIAWLTSLFIERIEFDFETARAKANPFKERGATLLQLSSYECNDIFRPAGPDVYHHIRFHLRADEHTKQTYAKTGRIPSTSWE